MKKGNVRDGEKSFFKQCLESEAQRLCVLKVMAQTVCQSSLRSVVFSVTQYNSRPKSLAMSLTAKLTAYLIIILYSKSRIQPPSDVTQTKTTL